jgi:DNA topoisomerase-3
LSVGRVQTPTLRLIVDRDQEIAAFTPTPYWQLAVTFRAEQGQYLGIWVRGQGKESLDRFTNREAAEAVAAKIRSASGGVVRSIEKKRVTVHPPLLFSLNDLQK